jgi:PRTRC genetic system protein C
MTLRIEQPIRKFTLGALELDDPAPDLAPDAALALYAPNFPQLHGAALSAPQVRPDGVLVYAVERPPVKTKG